HVRQLQSVALHGLGTLRAIGNACSVAEVDNCFVWQPITERFDYSEPANAGIKNADRSRVAHRSGKVIAVARRRNCRVTPFRRESESDKIIVPRGAIPQSSPLAKGEAEYVARHNLVICKRAPLPDD